jgi:hypothetical protein
MFAREHWMLKSGQPGTQNTGDGGIPLSFGVDTVDRSRQEYAQKIHCKFMK